MRGGEGGGKGRESKGVRGGEGEQWEGRGGQREGRVRGGEGKRREGCK